MIYCSTITQEALLSSPFKVKDNNITFLLSILGTLFFFLNEQIKYKLRLKKDTSSDSTDYPPGL